MKLKKWHILIALLLFTVFSFPNVAVAQPDQYGYNAMARTFSGTLDNWESIFAGSPPTPFDWNQKDTTFIVRKWDKKFDPVLKGETPLAAGAWEWSLDWEHMSGDLPGWTRHRFLEMVYSPNVAIPGAKVIPVESVGVPGFYLVRQIEWSTGPNGEHQVNMNFSVRNDVIKTALNLSGK